MMGHILRMLRGEPPQDIQEVRSRIRAKMDEIEERLRREGDWPDREEIDGRSR